MTGACLEVLDSRTTVLEMSVSMCLREKRIQQLRPAADRGGDGDKFSPGLTKTTIRRISSPAVLGRTW